MRHSTRRSPSRSGSLDLNGKPRPPWARWYVVVFLDVASAQLFSYGNSTFGMVNAFHELQQRVQVMGVLQGAEVMPVMAQLRDAS